MVKNMILFYLIHLENVMNAAAGTSVATSEDDEEDDESYQDGSADNLLVF